MLNAIFATLSGLCMLVGLLNMDDLADRVVSGLFVACLAVLLPIFFFQTNGAPGFSPGRFLIDLYSDNLLWLFAGAVLGIVFTLYNDGTIQSWLGYEEEE